MRAAMKKKGMSDADIEKTLSSSKKSGGTKAAAGKRKDYQFLLYPQYQKWAAAQRALQDQILKDDKLSGSYVQEMVRDLTRGHIESLIEGKYGAPDLNSVLKTAMQKIPAADQATLKSEQEGLLHDETELVDDSVDCRFAGLTVTKI